VFVGGGAKFFLPPEDTLAPPLITLWVYYYVKMLALLRTGRLNLSRGREQIDKPWDMPHWNYFQLWCNILFLCSCWCL